MPKDSAQATLIPNLTVVFDGPCDNGGSTSFS